MPDPAGTVAAVLEARVWIVSAGQHCGERYCAGCGTHSFPGGERWYADVQIGDFRACSCTLCVHCKDAALRHGAQNPVDGQSPTR